MDEKEREKALREYAKSKDLSVRYYNATNLWSVVDLQKGNHGKMVAQGLTFEEAYDFVDKYPW